MGIAFNTAANLLSTIALCGTHATVLIENGAGMKDVQKRSGHTDIQTIRQIYIHAAETMGDRSVDIFEKAVSI